MYLCQSCVRAMTQFNTREGLPPLQVTYYTIRPYQYHDPARLCTCKKRVSVCEAVYFQVGQSGTE